MEGTLGYNCGFGVGLVWGVTKKIIVTVIEGQGFGCTCGLKSALGIKVRAGVFHWFCSVFEYCHSIGSVSLVATV